MNPAFIILALLTLVLLWFLLAFIFRPLGILICRMWEEVKEEINKTDEEYMEEKNER